MKEKCEYCGRLKDFLEKSIPVEDDLCIYCLGKLLFIQMANLTRILKLQLDFQKEQRPKVDKIMERVEKDLGEGEEWRG